jgi:pimeloyl-ACP methyl ester carboxylesterase
VFFHGTPDCRLAARPGDAAAREAGVRMIAFDRPGYGGSPPAASDHVTVAADVAALADGLGLDRFAVLGMSIGGQYALAAAAVLPERVTGAGVVATPAVVPALDPPLPRDGLDAQGEAFFRRLAAGSVEANLASMRADFAAYVESVDPAGADDATLVARLVDGLNELDAALVGEWPAGEVAEMTREALVSPEGYLRDAAIAFRDWPFAPEAVRCPTHLWYGALDPQAAVRNGTWLAEHIPDARLVVRQDTAHLGTLHRHWPEVLAALTRA